MAAEDKDPGALATVEVVYPDGRTKLLSLEFPIAFGAGQWTGINICECGASIRYEWSKSHAVKQAACPKCGIIFIIKEPRL